MIYDVRPPLSVYDDAQAADTEPEDAISADADRTVLKPWILPTGNAFLKNPQERHGRPAGNPGSYFPFVQYGFDDSSWKAVNLPHDWAIKGPFFEGDDAEMTGGIGRLPSPGVAWYRKDLQGFKNLGGLLKIFYCQSKNPPRVWNSWRVIAE